MADLTYENAMRAMRSAYDKGDIESAKRMAAMAKSLQGQGAQEPRGQMMRHVNQGIANVADFINPFDEDHALNPFGRPMGSQQAADAMGIELGGEPETAWQAAQQGAGEAAATIIPVAKGLQAMRGMGGAVGQFADDAYQALVSLTGTGMEVTAGGMSKGAEKGAENAGAPEWVQQTAAIAAPMGLAGVRPAVEAASNVMPGARAAKEGVAAVKRGLMPYTKTGGREVARQQMQRQAGGEKRAAELAAKIDTRHEYGIPPAQQTGDERMIGLQNLAMDQDPNVRVRIEGQNAAAQAKGRAEIGGMGGDPEDSRLFFRDELRKQKARLEGMAQEANRRATDVSNGIEPSRMESENSVAVVDEIKGELAKWTAREKELWDEIPRGVRVGTARTKQVASEIVEQIPFAQRGSVPLAVREVLDTPAVYGDDATVNDMHGLYSELRRVARSRMAGNDQDKKAARVANEVADAILDDLGAKSGLPGVGQQIDNARQYSAMLHDTFDGGAVGKLLKRTLDGDEAVHSRLALDSTVGRMGNRGDVAAEELADATGGRSNRYVTDYIKDRFQRVTVSEKGFDNAAAHKFRRQNQELLDRYPELRGDITDAIEAHDSADAFAKRIEARIGKLENARTDARAAIVSGTDPAKAIFGSQNPIRAAQRLGAEARTDKTGKALAGLKGVLSDHLMGKSGDGLQDLSSVMSDTKTSAALRRIFDADEMNRLKVIGRYMDQASNTAGANVGTSLSGATPNKTIEFLARSLAVKHAPGPGGVRDLQTSAMLSGRVKEVFGRLVSDKASAILADAIEDPELFKALLTDARSATLEKRVLPRLLPYLVGTTSAQIPE